eukprot:Gb_30733 [translate_table: standard]
MKANMKLPTSTHVVAWSLQYLSQWWAPPCDRATSASSFSSRKRTSSSINSSSNSKGTRSIMFTSKEGSKKSSDSPSCGYGNPRGHLTKCHVGNVPLAVGPKHLVSL